MSTTLQTGKLFSQHGPAARDEYTGAELGWSDVGSGLSRILLGFLCSVLTTALGAGIILLVVLGPKMGMITKISKNAVDAFVLIGGGVIIIGSLFSYGLVLVGKWRCLSYAPERGGAKWWMFACILCLLAGPGLNAIASSGAGGTQNYKELGNGREGLANIQFQGVNGVMQLASAAISLASTLFFVMFLRTVGVCIGSETCVWLSTGYIFYTIALVVGTVFLYVTSRGLPRPDLLALLGLGWLGCIASYLVLIVTARCSIGSYIVAHPVRV
jgi:hypothetical protein